MYYIQVSVQAVGAQETHTHTRYPNVFLYFITHCEHLCRPFYIHTTTVNTKIYKYSFLKIKVLQTKKNYFNSKPTGGGYSWK